MPVSASLANQRLQSRSSLALPQAQRCSDSGSGPEGTADSTLLAQLDSITSLVLTAFGGNANTRNLPLYNQKNIKRTLGVLPLLYSHRKTFGKLLTRTASSDTRTNCVVTRGHNTHVYSLWATRLTGRGAMLHPSICQTMPEPKQVSRKHLTFGAFLQGLCICSMFLPKEQG